MTNEKLLAKLQETRHEIVEEWGRCSGRLQIMQSICETGDTDFTKFETDIANQIQQNANIASKKYSYFKIAVWITMSAYITPVLAAIFGIINYSQTKRPE